MPKGCPEKHEATMIEQISLRDEKKKRTGFIKYRSVINFSVISLLIISCGQDKSAKLNFSPEKIAAEKTNVKNSTLVTKS